MHIRKRNAQTRTHALKHARTSLTPSGAHPEVLRAFGGCRRHRGGRADHGAVGAKVRHGRAAWVIHRKTNLCHTNLGRCDGLAATQACPQLPPPRSIGSVGSLPDSADGLLLSGRTVPLAGGLTKKRAPPPFFFLICWIFCSCRRLVCVVLELVLNL